MTKDQLVYTVIDRVEASGKIDKSRIHDVDVGNVIAFYRSSFLKTISENDLDYYAKQYTATVQTDGTTGRKYATLPIQIENLNRVSKGVVSVSTTTGYDFKFYPCTEREMKLYDNLEVNLVNTRIGFITRYDRVDFDTSMSGISTVRLMLIPTFDEYSDTEDIPLGKFEKDIIEGSVNLLTGTPAAEKLNN